MTAKLGRELYRFVKKSIKKYAKKLTRDDIELFIIEAFDMYKFEADFYHEFLAMKPTQEQIDNLKLNMDEESKKLIDILIFRMYSSARNKGFFFKKDLFTDEELKMQKIPFVNDSSYGELIPKIKCLDESVYRYHTGLKLLPEAVLEKIKNTDFIDGGGFIGDTAFVFLDYSPKTVHSFEPCQINYNHLINNIKNKQVETKVIPVKMGVADKCMETSASGDGVCFSARLQEDTNVQNIQCTTIDKYGSENNLNIGVIKLDVEGFELETIKGATETLLKQKPVLLISLYHNPKDFFGVKPYIDSLGLDYKFMVKKLNNSHLTVETMLIGY